MVKKISSPEEQFQSGHYLQHNFKRFEHLDRLPVAFARKSVLEVGAGIGDHTEYLLGKGVSRILVTEGRPENLAILKKRFAKEPRTTVKKLDMESPKDLGTIFDFSYCYGLLYHLSNPLPAIEFLAQHTQEICLLETCVSYLQPEGIEFPREIAGSFSQSISGQGCRPGRNWLFDRLREHFEYVYMPIIQPDHEQFPTDWTGLEPPARYTRAIFIASRVKLDDPLLKEEIPLHQLNIKDYPGKEEYE